MSDKHRTISTDLIANVQRLTRTPPMLMGVPIVEVELMEYQKRFFVEEDVIILHPLPRTATVECDGYPAANLTTDASF